MYDRRARRRRMLARAKVVGDRLLGVGKPVEGYAEKVSNPNLWDALTSFMLPRAYWPIDHNEKRSFVRLDIHVRLRGPDRLRLLLTGDLRVLSTVYTDVEVKQCTALTNVEVHPFRTKE